MARTIRISTENNDFQHAEVLKRNRVKRQKNKEFFVEGVRSIEQAIKNNWKISALLYSKENKLSNWAKNILKNSKAEKHFVLPLKLMKKLSGKEETSEMIALIRMREDDLSRIKIKKNMLIVIFDRPSSPGNLGTIIRSCESLKADGFIMTGHAVDLYDPQTIRASMGSLFSLPCVRLPSHKGLLPWIKKIKNKIGDIQIIGTSAKAIKDITKCNFKKPTIVIIGNETLGMSLKYKELCNEIVRIPIYGSATSLNVSCAASILLYEIDRQRRTLNSNI